MEIVRRTTDAMQTALERYDLDADVDVEAIAVEFDVESPRGAPEPAPRRRRRCKNGAHRGRRQSVSSS